MSTMFLWEKIATNTNRPVSSFPPVPLNCSSIWYNLFSSPVGCREPSSLQACFLLRYILASIQLFRTTICIDNGVIPPRSFQINMIGRNNSLILIALQYAWVEPLNASELLRNNGLVHHPKPSFSNSCLYHTHPDNVQKNRWFQHSWPV